MSFSKKQGSKNVQLEFNRNSPIGTCVEEETEVVFIVPCTNFMFIHIHSCPVGDSALGGQLNCQCHQAGKVLVIEVTKVWQEILERNSLIYFLLVYS